MLSLRCKRFLLSPYAIPASLSGLVVFAISMGEFEATSMLAGFGTLTLFPSLRESLRAASAVASLLLYGTLLALLGLTWARRRPRRRGWPGAFSPGKASLSGTRPGPRPPGTEALAWEGLGRLLCAPKRGGWVSAWLVLFEGGFAPISKCFYVQRPSGQ